MLKRLVIALATFSLVLGIGLVAASPAQAAWSDCPTGTGCVWTDQNGAGVIFVAGYSAYGPAGTCRNLPGVMPANGESARTSYGNGYGFRFYTNWNCVNSRNSSRWEMRAGEIETWPSAPKKNGARSFQIIYNP